MGQANCAARCTTATENPDDPVMQGSAEIFGKYPGVLFKNPMSISANRAAAEKRDFFYVGLRQTLISSLKAVMTLLILMSVAGCSFHSAQWESAKALWAMRAPAMQSGQETYWWDMEHEGQTYRLFPVSWNDKTVLTDAKRWMIVLQNSKITIIRDLRKNQQITFEHSVDKAIGTGETVGDSDSSWRYFDSSDSGVWTEVSIVERSNGNPMDIAKTSTFCAPPRFDSQSLRLITRCFLGKQETDMRVAEFDQSGNILSLRLNLLTNKTWAIYRSGDLVDAFEVKDYLDGDVDDI